MAKDLVTVAGVTGPGLTLASRQFSDVSSIHVDFDKQVLTLTRKGGAGPLEVDLFGITTVTYTISSHVATVSMT